MEAEGQQPKKLAGLPLDFQDDPTLQALADRYGIAAVWQAGIEVSEYPPTWQLSGFQLMQVAELLNQKNERN